METPGILLYLGGKNMEFNLTVAIVVAVYMLAMLFIG